MSIIVQAGHHSSNSSKLMHMLYERGLNKPNDSYTHKLNYHQVTNTMDKILSRSINSIANSKLADNIMVDFLLANLDVENWGWESEKNLSTLEYWQQLEPDVRFILVFDHPKKIFNKLQADQITVTVIEDTINEWIIYHQEMLNIIKLYDDKSILVEGDCAVQNIVNLNKQVSNLARTLKLKSSWQINTKSTPNSKTVPVEGDVVTELVSKEILYKYPEAIRIFNELLVKASMKCSLPIHKNKNNELEELIVSLNYLRSKENFEKYKLENEGLSKNICKLENNNKKLAQGLDSFKHEAEAKNQALTQKLYQTQNILEEYNSKVNEYEQQLALIKEELNKEKQKSKNDEEFIKARVRGETISKNEGDRDNANSQEDKELIINDLLKEDEVPKQKLESKNNHHDYAYENEMLHSHLHKVQEELEKYYLENQKLKIANTNEQRESKTTLYYGAADRIKQDLPYRLGSTMVSRSKNPKDFATLPLALVKEYRDFKNSLNTHSLPDIELYHDKHEAEKVKKHLSYRLGSLVTEKTSSPRQAITLPFLLMKEVRKFKK